MSLSTTPRMRPARPCLKSRFKRENPAMTLFSSYSLMGFTFSTCHHWKERRSQVTSTQCHAVFSALWGEKGAAVGGPDSSWPRGRSGWCMFSSICLVSAWETTDSEAYEKRSGSKWGREPLIKQPRDHR